MGHKQHSHFKLTFSQSREAFIEGHGQATTKKSNLKGKAGLVQSEFSLKNQQDRVQSSQLYKHNMRWRVCRLVGAKVHNSSEGYQDKQNNQKQHGACLHTLTNLHPSPKFIISFHSTRDVFFSCLGLRLSRAAWQNGAIQMVPSRGCS